MKAYTDLNQSKKLAEILPLDSSDHHYVRKVCDFRGNAVDGEWSWPKYGNINSKYANYIVQNFTRYEEIPCWSLAALFAALQNHCGILETRLRTNKKYNVFAAIGGFVYNSFEEHPDGIDIIDGLYELTLMLNKEKLL